jgi:hypothetical protein
LQRLADALKIDSGDLLAFLGVKPSVPEPRVYFRRAYGMSDSEAAEAEAIIANLRAHQHGQHTDENNQAEKGGEL